MPEDTHDEKMLVVAAPKAPPENKGSVRGPRRGFPFENIQAVSVSAVKKNMEAFFSQLQRIISPAKNKIGEFELSTIEITAQVTGEGKVCLLGTGVKVEAQGGIKFVLNRAKE